MRLELSKEHPERPVQEKGQGLKKPEKQEAFGGQLRKFGSCSENTERGGVASFVLQDSSVLLRMDWGRGRKKPGWEQGDPFGDLCSSPGKRWGDGPWHGDSGLGFVFFFVWFFFFSFPPAETRSLKEEVF